MLIKIRDSIIEVDSLPISRDVFIRSTFKKVSELGTKLSDDDLTWAIKLEDFYKQYADLSDKQIMVLWNIFQKAAAPREHVKKETKSYGYRSNQRRY